MFVLPCDMRSNREKIFQNKGSQSEVLIRRDGERVIMEPIDHWPSQFQACLGAWPKTIERLPTVKIDQL